MLSPNTPIVREVANGVALAYLAYMGEPPLLFYTRCRQRSCVALGRNWRPGVVQHSILRVSGKQRTLIKRFYRADDRIVHPERTFHLATNEHTSPWRSWTVISSLYLVWYRRVKILRIRGSLIEELICFWPAFLAEFAPRVYAQLYTTQNPDNVLHVCMYFQFCCRYLSPFSNNVRRKEVTSWRGAKYLTVHSAAVCTTAQPFAHILVALTT